MVRQSLKINIYDTDIWNNKGLCHHNLGKYEEAIECYDKALELNPDYIEIWNNKGLTNMK